MNLHTCAVARVSASRGPTASVIPSPRGAGNPENRETRGIIASREMDGTLEIIETQGITVT